MLFPDMSFLELPTTGGCLNSCLFHSVDNLQIDQNIHFLQEAADRSLAAQMAHFHMGFGRLHRYFVERTDLRARSSKGHVAYCSSRTIHIRIAIVVNRATFFRCHSGDQETVNRSLASTIYTTSCYRYIPGGFRPNPKSLYLTLNYGTSILVSFRINCFAWSKYEVEASRQKVHPERNNSLGNLIRFYYVILAYLYSTDPVVVQI